MGIWYWGVLGNDSDCELLRDYLEICGADVPPREFQVIVFNKDTDRWLLVRHDEPYYRKLRRAYRNVDASCVEAAYPRLVAHAQEREDGVFVLDTTIRNPGPRQLGTQTCVSNSFVVLSALILAAGARMPARLREVCVAACRGCLDALRARYEPGARRAGRSVENLTGVQTRKAFLEMFRKHKGGTARVLTYAVDADLKASFRGDLNNWGREGHPLASTTRRVHSAGALWVPTAETLPASLDRAFFAACPEERIIDTKQNSSPGIMDAMRKNSETFGSDDPEQRAHIDAAFARATAASERTCEVCAAKASPEKPLLSCARCHSAFYCDVACQRKAWNDGHKKRCKALAAAREKIKDDIKQTKKQLKEGTPWPCALSSAP
jgi:hypothetical protein